MGELIPIIMFIVIGFVISFHLMTRHKERHLLIEKGLGIEDLKKLYTKSLSAYNTAKWAFILLFGGVGLFIGIWISDQTREDGYILASVAVSVGIGLLLWQKIYGAKADNDEKM